MHSQEQQDLGPMAEQMETVMSALLQTLSDRDTVVRCVANLQPVRQPCEKRWLRG